MPAWPVSERTTSTCTSSTTSTGRRHGTRSGKPSTWPHRRGRSSTRAVAILPVGISRQAQETAARHGLMGLVSEQSIYNLLTRDVELEVLPAAQAYGLGFLAWAPLHEGILGGRSSAASSGKRRRLGRAADAAAQRGSQLAQFEALAGELGHEPGELALAWLLSQPAVTAPIIGPVTFDNSSQLCGPRRSASTWPAWPAWTRSSRATGRHPKTTPGDPLVKVRLDASVVAAITALLGERSSKGSLAHPAGQNTKGTLCALHLRDARRWGPHRVGRGRWCCGGGRHWDLAPAASAGRTARGSCPRGRRRGLPAPP